MKKNSKKSVVRRISKKEIYARFGIEYRKGKILAPLYGWINPLLINGNAKLGKGVFTFSTLPGNMEYSVDIDGTIYTVKGTCLCNCVGCYAQTGFYRMPSVLKSLAIKTILCRKYPEFVKNAIIAQIKAENIKLCRIHAAGDFYGPEYIAIWQDIVKACDGCAFWSYTKNPAAETAFDAFKNCNIVKSILPGFGFNFGHCDYILMVYRALRDMGKPVYICRCGIDKNQHCVNCHGCAKNEFVLFIEHSTAYKAEDDPAFSELAAIIENQAKPE